MNTLGRLELAVMMRGAIVIETLFGLGGVGRLAISSALKGDFPVVIGTTIFAACFELCTLLPHLARRWCNPTAKAIWAAASRVRFALPSAVSG